MSWLDELCSCNERRNFHFKSYEKNKQRPPVNSGFARSAVIKCATLPETTQTIKRDLGRINLQIIASVGKLEMFTVNDDN